MHSFVGPLALGTALLSIAPVFGADADLGRVLPGTFHGGAFSNFRRMLQDFPAIAHEGWLGETLDHWVDQGYPDPRALAGQMGFGVNVDVAKRVPRDVLVVGSGPLRLAKRVTQLADAAGVPMKKIPYRGVVFLQPGFQQVPLWVSEVAGGISHFHYDPDRKFLRSRQLVNTLHGQQVSFGDKHNMSLDSETYVLGGIQIPIFAAQEARQLWAQRSDGPETAGLHLVVHATGAWRRGGGKVNVGLEFETFTSLEAGAVTRWLADKVEAWKAEASEPTLVAMLDAVVVRHVGKHIFLELEYEFAAAQQAVRALNRQRASSVD